MSYASHKLLAITGNYLIVQSDRTVEVMYTRADVFVDIDGCEKVWLDIDILFELPCITNDEEDKYSWTLAFVDSEINVYLFLRKYL